MRKKILFCHLLNNYTGSPKVLATELQILSKKNDYKITLLTSKSCGFLSGINNVIYKNNGYRWSNNKIILILSFAFTQIYSFLFVLFHKFDIVYINTVVPFGVAIAAKIRHERIIYHVHEVYLNPGFIKRLYIQVMKKCADRVICVSQYVKDNLSAISLPCSVIYNPVEKHEVSGDLEAYLQKKFDGKKIFMPTSLKEYKGVKQFVELAFKNKKYFFILLCSVPVEEIRNYFSNISLPDNLSLIGRQENLLSYYSEVAVTMNLSLPDKVIETFGLTLIEGFDAFTPAIAPNFGGPKEIISEGENGFLVNPYDLESISEKLDLLLQDFKRYKQFAYNANSSLFKYDITVFIEKIINEIQMVVINE